MYLTSVDTTRPAQHSIAAVLTELQFKQQPQARTCANFGSTAVCQEGLVRSIINNSMLVASQLYLQGYGSHAQVEAKRFAADFL